MENHSKKVTYYYDPDIGQFYYGQGHPMKPHRVRMAHSLILHYGLYQKMDCYRPAKATEEDMHAFHSPEYIRFLASVSPSTLAEYEDELTEWNLAEDCPAFDGLWPYCQIYTGGSLGAAVKLNYQAADIAINWAGGLHHAKKAEASGFCYVNDIVLAILELLKYQQRVLYIDIDVHHGDGVEEAFSTTDRVMTVSFHKFGSGFFPGTGDIVNIGHGKGKYYSLNIPLKDGITDDAYQSLFRPVMTKIMHAYSPEVVVLQCGADSLAGDRLGVFNLSSKGHAACVEFMKSFNVPLMLLGGGGYKISNVARCWAYETGVALGVDMDEALPPNEYYETYSGVNYELTVKSKDSTTDQNSREYLEDLQRQCMEYLRHVTPISVGFSERPADGMQLDNLEQVHVRGSDRQDEEGSDGVDKTGSAAVQRGYRLWDDSDAGGAGGSGAGDGRSGVDISYKDGDVNDDDGDDGAGVHDEQHVSSPFKHQVRGGSTHQHHQQMWDGAGSLRSPFREKPSMLRPPAALEIDLTGADGAELGLDLKVEEEIDDDEVERMGSREATPETFISRNSDDVLKGEEEG